MESEHGFTVEQIFVNGDISVPSEGEFLEGEFAASPLAADGKIYCVSEKGTTSVLQAGREAKILATNELDDTILASPVASGGAIFLRSDKYLYCIGR